jgi:polysaccharide deacetylase 2 family uncharacterized protein YibQ
VERIASWPYPVCGAVLPVLPGSGRAATTLEQSGKQVILHLRTVETDLDSVPGAVGVNNHMGSAATADPRVMRAVVRVLARRGLFFLDSRTTGSTVAREAARQEGVPAVSRRVFLDDVATEEAIGKAVDELVLRARAEGFAVAVGHPYPATLAVLERELPKLAQRGVRLVNVSELAK